MIGNRLWRIVDCRLRECLFTWQCRPTVEPESILGKNWPFLIVFPLKESGTGMPAAG